MSQLKNFRTTKENSILQFLSQKNRSKNCRSANEVQYVKKKSYHLKVSLKLRQFLTPHVEINDFLSDKCLQSAQKKA